MSSIYTPDFFWAANKAPETGPLLETWQAMPNKIRLCRCADSRCITCAADMLMIFSAVSANVPTNELISLFQDGVVFIMTHFDELEFVPGSVLIGCGGLQVRREQLINGSIDQTRPAHQFVVKIYHPDPIIQGTIVGKLIAEKTGNWVFVGGQGHRSGRIYVFSMHKKLRSGAMHSVSAIKEQYTYPGSYSPADIYADGIPNLSREDIAGHLDDVRSGENQLLVWLERAEAEVALLAQEEPDLPEKHRIQQPGFFHLSTSVIPNTLAFGGRLPRNSGYTVRMARGKETVGARRRTTISADEMQSVAQQTDFGLISHILHQNQASASFPDTNRMLVTTPSMDLTLRVVRRLEAYLDSMRTWLTLPDHRVIGAKKYGGNVEEIDYLKLV